MAGIFISGDDSQIVVSVNGHRIGGNGLLTVDPMPHNFAVYPVTNTIIIPSPAEVSAFKLPSMYEMLPEIVRAQDNELVSRGDVPLYAWDSIPAWDTEPFTWDEVIGPEPILKATVRVMQLELEKTCAEIASLTLLNNLDRVPKEFLPYHASLLGTPLPAATEIAQRSFLKELVRTYRRKGTPLSFFRLFEQLGFTLTLAETYQRKGDFAEITGPQMALKSNTLIVDEPLGTTVTGQTTYTFQVMETPITKGSIKLEVFDQSQTTPTVITDNGFGEWSDGIVGDIDYFNGRVTFTLPGAPALIGQPIQITYNQRIDPFPDLDNQRFTDRVRSSVVKFAIEPKDLSIGLTEEIIDRIALYLDLLKPAHVIIQSLDLLLRFVEDENENIDDELNPFSYLFVESVFGTHYIGEGWAQEDNGSEDPNPSVFAQHRDGNEFIIDPNVFDGAAPYVYPWTLNGNFRNPPIVDGGSPTTRETEWIDTAETVLEGTVTNDVAPTTTRVSLSFTASTLGAGDTIAFTSGPSAGEARIIDTMTNVGPGNYWDITWLDPLPVVPVVGNDASVLPVEAVNLQNLQAGFREQDPLEMGYVTSLTPTPDGASVGPFTGTIDSGVLPPAGTTITLRYAREADSIIVDGVAGPYDLDALNGGGDVNLTIALNGAAGITTVLSSASFADFSAATAAEIAPLINANFPGLASDSAGTLRLTHTPPAGPDGSVHVPFSVNDANDAIGLPQDIQKITIYTETATAPGTPGSVAWSNVNGHINSGTVNTATGAITVTFDAGDEPKSGVIITVSNSFNGSQALGDF
jgi:P2-related tail formation protein